MCEHVGHPGSLCEIDIDVYRIVVAGRARKQGERCARNGRENQRLEFVARRERLHRREGHVVRSGRRLSTSVERDSKANSSN